jgi:NADPH:quinone reductase
MTGQGRVLLRGAWVVQDLYPMGNVPTGVKLTSYSGRSGDITAEELARYVKMVEYGSLKVTLGPVFRFDELVEAHRAMDANSVNGKMVVVI